MTRLGLRDALGWSALALVFDQATKWLILNMVMQPPRAIEVAPFLNLRLGFNRGVSFGMGGDWIGERPQLMSLLMVVAALGLLAWALSVLSRLERAGLSSIAGGSLGNAADRFRQGAVTDFIDLHWSGWHWPTFNGADVAITFGVALMVASAWTDVRRPKASTGEAVRNAPSPAIAGRADNTVIEP